MVGRQRLAPSPRGEAGKAGLGSLVALIVVVVAVYFGMKLVPVYAASYQFDDTVREQVVFAGARRRKLSDQEVKRNLVQRAQELGLPIQERNIRITRRSSTIRIQVAYKVPVDMGFDFTYDWVFTPDHDGPSF